MENRRELSTRKIGFFRDFAKFLCGLGLTPNSVSVLSVLFAVMGAYGFYLMGRSCFTWGWWLAFSGIQLRLLCNMIDGLMAVEGGMKTRFGELFNDLPDRFSDVLLIFAASILIRHEYGRDIGWLASLLAVMTAYVRVLAGYMGFKVDFCGPMAKQHRMATLNIALLIGGGTYFYALEKYISDIFLIALGVIILGSVLTCIRRLYRMRAQV